MMPEINVWENTADKCKTAYNATFGTNIGIDIYDTSADMLEKVFPRRPVSETLRLYSERMSSQDYQSAHLNKNGKKKYYTDCIDKLPSFKRYGYHFSIYGLATKPNISVTIEGLIHYWFKFTIFHEMTHIAFNTKNENFCNKLALHMLMKEDLLGEI